MSARSYLPVIFTVAVLLPCAAFANTAKGTAVIIHNSVSGMDNQSYILLFIPPMTALMKRLPYFSMTGSAGLPRLKKNIKTAG